MTDPAPPPAKPRRSRLHRLSRGTVLLLCVLALLGAAGAFWLIGRPVAAPDWVQARIEARLAQEMPAARVSFGEVSLLVEKGWRPRVRLRNVRIETLAGHEVLSFAEFRASLSMRALLRRQLKPKSVSLTGVFATLRRDTDGKLSLRGGVGVATPSQEAADFAELARHLDELMQQPALQFLRTAELRGLTLRFEDLRAKRVWTVDGGRLIATRRGDLLSMTADLAVLGGGTGVATISANYESRIGATQAAFGVTIDGMPAADIASQSPAFAWLDILRAPISGSVRGGLNPDATLAPLYATLQIGKGVVQPNDAAQPIPFDAARSYFTYDAAKALLHFDELSVKSKWVTGRAEGTATLIGLASGKMKELVGQFRLTDLRANPLAVYPEPIALEAAEMDFKLRLDPFLADLGRLQIADGSATLSASGQLSAGEDGWRLALDAQLDQIAPTRLLTLWPKALKPKTRNWVAENLLEGRLRNADFALRLAPAEKPRTYLAFDFADAGVRFMRTMPPIRSGFGQASLDKGRFVVSLDSGAVTAPDGGDVQLAGSSFIIPDVTIRDGTPSVVRLKTRSTVTAALSLLDAEPMRVMTRTGLPVDLVAGEALLEGTLAVPLKKGGKPQDVRFDAEGTLLSVTSEKLIKGRRLAADSLRVRADNDGVQIAGVGTLDGVPFEGAWDQPIGAGALRSSLRGAVTLSPKALDTFNISLPPGMLTGQGTAQIAIDLERGKPPEFALGSDLEGLRLAVPQLSWVKPESEAGSFEITGKLGKTPKIDGFSLSAAGLATSGTIILRDGGALARLSLDQLRLGGWLDAKVDLIGQGPGQVPQVVVRGGTLDLRSAQFGSSPANGDGQARAGPPMEISLDRLQITDTIALSNLRGTFSTGQGLDGSFVARVNGGARIEGRVAPQDGRIAIRLTSEDAGGVMRAAGVLQQAVGGTMELVLLPVGQGGAYDGRLSVKNTRIKDAPAMAALLNAVSVVGLLDQMNGEGIYFDEVIADFRLTPGRMTLTSGSAIGASMGISMDGVYATDTGQIAMQGVISPVYLLNGIGSVFSRRGEGMFGFNYGLSGQAKSPKVSVNPLSALTPGGLRNIFRGPQTELPAVEGATGSALPPVTTQAPVAREYEGR